MQTLLDIQTIATLVAMIATLILLSHAYTSPWDECRRKSLKRFLHSFFPHIQGVVILSAVAIRFSIGILDLNCNLFEPGLVWKMLLIIGVGIVVMVALNSLFLPVSSLESKPKQSNVNVSD